MNRIIRMLTITGLGLFASVTIGAGPAMAATNTGQGAVKSSTTDATAKPGDRVVDYYDSRAECRIAGRIGERLGRWDDWNCYPSDGGWHDGDWALTVDYNFDGGFPFDHGHHGGFDHNRHGGFDHNRHGGHHQNHQGGMRNNVGMPSAKPNRG